MSKKPTSKEILVATRCHEIQVNLGSHEVPEFEKVPEIGMAVRLALHIRGLTLIDYEVLRMVASHFLGIPTLVIRRILGLLAEIEFVRLQSTGETIKGVLPTVPYYEDMFALVGQYALKKEGFNEHEQLALEMVNRLSKSPENKDSLFDKLGAEAKLYKRIVKVGTEGAFLIERRARGKDILLSPTYFSENAEIFSDAVAGVGAKKVSSLMETLRGYQGWPLKLIEKKSAIGEIDIDDQQLNILKRLAQDGAIKPPCIETTYKGRNYFLFTPTPTGAALNPTKREVYEKAMAIVAAIRQGQLLPHRYAIRSPGAVLYALKTNKRLSRATTEASQQYRNLVHLRIGRLVDVGNGFSEFHIIDQPENDEALKIAYNLVANVRPSNIEVDDEARMALQRDQSYIESLVASTDLRRKEVIHLSEEAQIELDFLILGGEIR